MKNTLSLFAFFIIFSLTAQVGIGTTSPHASLDIQSSNEATPSNTDGILIPKIDGFPLTNPGADQDGMLVFATGDGLAERGFYYWNNSTTSWVTVAATKIDELSDGKSDVNGYSIYLGIGAGANHTVPIFGLPLENVGIGYLSLTDNTIGYQNVAIGYQSMYFNDGGSLNTSIGHGSMWNMRTGYGNTAVGVSSFAHNSDGYWNTAIGSEALSYNYTGDHNTAFGSYAGFFNNGSANIFIGYNSGYNEPGSNKLYIENSDADADNALIYGEFDTNILRANGELQIGNPTSTGYALPTADGTANQILVTDGNGQLSFTAAPSGGATYIDDLGDGKSDGRSVFLGLAAGANDDGTLNENVGLGYSSLAGNIDGTSNTAIGTSSLGSNTSGNENTSIGYASLNSNLNGLENTAIGSASLYLNSNGSRNTAIGTVSGFLNQGVDNVFIGYSAGFDELGSNKLYIENSDADANNALIYGEFDNDILRTNGELQIGNPTTTGYAFPTADGTANQILVTDGNGQLSFTAAPSGGATYIDDLGDGKSDGRSVFLGLAAGANDDGTLNENVGLGYSSLAGNIDGTSNTAIGTSSLGSNTSGNENTSIGYASLNSNLNGLENTAIGSASLYLNSNGSRNTAIGTVSGFLNQGVDNVFIGYSAGFDELGSNKLYIENSDADANNALIYGEFDNDILRTNGELQIGNPTTTGYAFPTADGTANQILVTDGNGQLSFTAAPSGGATEIDDLSDGKSDGLSVYLGAAAGVNDDGTFNENVGLGYNSLTSNIDGTTNTAIGSFSSYSNVSGNSNTSIGAYSMYNKMSGDYNTTVGLESLTSNTTGSNNTIFGSLSFAANSTGNNNTAMGSYSGLLNQGSDNIFIGYSAGYNETGSNKLFIENSDSATPLIYGTFNTNEVGINWNSGTALPNTLSVNGNASKSTAGSWLANSDRRLKKNIETITPKEALDKISNLRGVTYQWNDNQTGIDRPTEMQYGFIAQEIMEVFPEKVTEDGQGFYQTAYGDYDALFVQSIKELKSQLEGKDKRIKVLEDALQSQELLIERINAIEAKLNLKTDGKESYKSVID